MSDGLNPLREFFVAVTPANADGTLNLACEGLDGFATIDDAITKASTEVEDHGGVAFIYRCIPIKRITAYRVRVEDIQNELNANA